MLIPDPKYLFDSTIVSRLRLQLHMYNFDCIIPGKMEVAASFSESKRTRQTTYRLVQLLRQCGGQSMNNKPGFLLISPIVFYPYSSTLYNVQYFKYYLLTLFCRFSGRY